MARNTDLIVELLIDYGKITQAQLDEAKKFLSSIAESIDIIEALKRLKFITEDEITKVLAQEYGMEFIDLKAPDIPPDVIKLIPPEVAKQYNVLPLSQKDGIITIAIGDPTDMNTVDTIRYLLNSDVEAVVAADNQIRNAVMKYYPTAFDSVENFVEDINQDADDYEVTSNIGEVEEDMDAPIIRLVHSIITEAYKMKASDIHLEPMEKSYRIRYRIDGALVEMEAPPKSLQMNLTSRVKIMSKLDITEKRIPQDGRIQLKMKEKDIDLRVSTVPTSHGESIVMRILDKSSIQLDIPQLGFYADDLTLINKILAFPDGIFLVTGPTGSGKTTSLYAFLNNLNKPTRKIITVEDPVEYQLSGICQVQVVKQIDMTFARALRAILRQAPNVVMVGEIRDLETSEIAINASLTGHLVFSTLHTNDAPGAMTRLIDMGVKPFLVAAAVRAAMAQRLLRKICPKQTGA